MDTKLIALQYSIQRAHKSNQYSHKAGHTKSTTEQQLFKRFQCDKHTQTAVAMFLVISLCSALPGHVSSKLILYCKSSTTKSTKLQQLCPHSLSKSHKKKNELISSNTWEPYVLSLENNHETISCWERNKYIESTVLFGSWWHFIQTLMFRLTFISLVK